MKILDTVQDIIATLKKPSDDHDEPIEDDEPSEDFEESKTVDEPKASKNHSSFSFEDEVYYSIQDQRNKWAKVAIGSLILSGICVASIFFLVPLKEIRPYVVMVEKTTGEAEKIVEVQPLTLTEEEAVLEAEVVSYITDLETYDLLDNAVRLPEVLRRSSGQADEHIRSVWTPSSPEYPPGVYGEDTRVRVYVKSVTKLSDGIVRVRFRKVRETVGAPDVPRSFVATIGYSFEPSSTRSLNAVWKNPLGFLVNSYRVDVENLK